MIPILIALVLTGGTAVAAETSLPGDLLYPVKIHVNENVRAATAVGAEANARWEAERAARRLHEAESLAEKGRLDADARAEVLTEFNASVEGFKNERKDVEESKGADKANALDAELEASLVEHAAILERIGEQRAEVRTEVNAVIDSVRVQVENVSPASEPSPVETTTDPSVDVKTDIQTDADVKLDTPVLDLKTDGAVKGGVNLGL